MIIYILVDNYRMKTNHYVDKLLSRGCIVEVVCHSRLNMPLNPRGTIIYV